jgi:hypothetical protein
MWQPVIDSFRKRLGRWKRKLISSGSKVVLINSVLTSLPLYHFSVFKVPKGVLKTLIGMQRDFLWGISFEKRKTTWVSWDVIVKPKNLGGLGTKDLELFHYSLLGKW